MTSTPITPITAITENTPTTATAPNADDERAVSALWDRYLVSLDDEEPDDVWAAGLFTEDAAVAFPVGRHQGVDGMAEFHRVALATWAATQHLGSPAVVVTDGDRATLRGNLLSTHVHHPRPGVPDSPLFATGTFMDGTARRTARGWRLSLLTFRLLWSNGTPPSA